MISYQRIGHLLFRYMVAKIKRRPYVLNIEVTHRCNARCEHCVCWRIEPRNELSDYVDVVRHFNPIIVWFTGGEPLVRNDIYLIISRIREVDPHIYLGLATNGWLLNADLGKQLVEAGLDQVNISLDFMGSQHDEFRRIDGLYKHIEMIVPELRRLGIRVVLVCCIMRENLDSLLPIAELAEAWGVEVGYSCYSFLKTGDKGKFVTGEQIRDIYHIIDNLCGLKKRHGAIKSSLFYLRKIPEFYEKGTVGICQATKNWLYVTPDGYLKICPDKEIYGHYKGYSGSLNFNCGECWYTCRGEMETPFLERFIWEVRKLRRTKPSRSYIRSS